MKIYRRSEFMKLPAWTIYSQSKPYAFDSLSIKGDTFGNDWATLSPMWIESASGPEQDQRLDGMLERGESYPMQQYFGRDGRFDDDNIFLVMEHSDLLTLRGLIDKAIYASNPKDQDA